MTRRILKIIAALLLIAIPTFIVVKNREVVPVYYAGETPISTSVGVLVLVVFLAGAFAASLVASVIGLFSWWENKKLRRKEKIRNAFYAALVDARMASASRDWSKAKTLWLGILKKDPDNLIARLELSRVHQQLGELREGLAVIEVVRAQHSRNAELLFQSAELLERSGSLTAALDNLLPLLANGFNARAAEMVIELHQKLGRWEDALEVWEQLDDHGIASVETGARIKFNLLSNRAFARTEDELSALLEFIKKFPFFSLAYERLAQLYQEGGAPIEAAHTLLKGAKGGKSIELYRQAIDLFLEHPRDHEKAVSAARSAIAVVPPTSQVAARLLLASVCVRLERTEEAEVVLREMKDFCSTRHISLNHSDHLVHLCLQGMILAFKERELESRLMWRELLREAMKPGSTDSSYDHLNGISSDSELGQEAPAPFLFS